jgi:tetratricopeptide (TPR) repeat protein
MVPDTEGFPEECGCRVRVSIMPASILNRLIARMPRVPGALGSTILIVCITASLSGCLYFSTEYQITYGLNHYEMGLYDLAIPPLVTAAKSLEGKTPPDSRLVEVFIALGTMAMRTEHKDLAVDFFPKALKVAEALNPADSRRLRNALVNLGMFYAENERPREAIPLLKRAATISIGLDGQVYYAIDLDNIGFAHQRLGEYAEASEYSLKALDVIEHVTTGNYIARTKGVILHNLASAFVELNRYVEAEANFKKSLAVLQSAPAEVEPWRLEMTKKSYADFLHRIGRLKEAEEIGAQPKGEANIKVPALQEQLPASEAASRHPS